MSKYLKLFIFNAVFFTYAAFIANAQETNSDKSDEEVENDDDEEEEEESIKAITTPSVIPSAELSGIESNSIIKFFRNPNRGTLSIAAS